MRQLRAVITIPSENAREKCSPKRLAEVTDFALSKVFTATCEQWITNVRKQGYDYRAQDDVHVYGPYPSRNRLAPIMDVEMLLSDDWTPFAVEKDESPSAFSMYMLVANFNEKVEPGKTDSGLVLARS